PTEIAYDFETTRRTLDAIGRRPEFGINFDPSHMIPQFLDPAAFIEEFADRIYHVHVKDSRRRLDGRRSILGSHLEFGEGARGWVGGGDPGGGGGDAGVRVHGQGPLQRVPDDPVHDLAAAAAAQAGRHLRPQPAGGRRGRPPLWLRAGRDGLAGARRRRAG